MKGGSMKSTQSKDLDTSNTDLQFVVHNPTWEQKKITQDEAEATVRLALKYKPFVASLQWVPRFASLSFLFGSC
ncbi:hypothetical protein FACS1894116_04310 [Betaproteobacteria bacterium]|nr:hypothetical protein FACS1894116_04310 [Betaproteobacteria bacterium]GHT97898.1 hypothetical protein FACS1894154_02290 [Betaproteobacteria bacterium]